MALLLLSFVPGSTPDAQSAPTERGGGKSLLAGLPALPKPHWSWPRRLPRGADTVNDTFATLRDYGRITHSLPLYLGRLPHQSAQALAEWDESIRICAEVNCTLALNWSPWYACMPGKMGPADASYRGPEEADSMVYFTRLLANASAALAALNTQHRAAVQIGAVLLDSEKYLLQKTQVTESTNLPLRLVCFGLGCDTLS